MGPHHISRRSVFAGIVVTILAGSFLGCGEYKVDKGLESIVYADSSKIKSVTPEKQLVDLTQENYAGLIVAKRPTFIFLTSPSCGPCKLFEPAFEEVAKQYDPNDILFLRVNGYLELPVENTGRIGGRPRLTLVYEGRLLTFFSGRGIYDLGLREPATLKKKVDELVKTYCRGYKRKRVGGT